MRLKSDFLQSTSPFKEGKFFNLSGKGVIRREGKRLTPEKFEKIKEKNTIKK